MTDIGFLGELTREVSIGVEEEQPQKQGDGCWPDRSRNVHYGCTVNTPQFFCKSLEVPAFGPVPAHRGGPSANVWFI